MQKVLDAMGRHRSKQMAVHVTGEELSRVWRLAEKAGLAKQAYIYRALEEPILRGIGNPRLFRALEGRLRRLERLLRERAEDCPEDPLLGETAEALRRVLSRNDAEKEAM